MTQYSSPQVKVVKISTRTGILNNSLDTIPIVNNYRKGSESTFSFGDEDD